ncbi:hypothetical protein AOL_s00078g220 [Orbilia oligospora ATCC 24927]|uniref:Fungal calcium binding protein domain-containing protein n=2 Tax=Orbilia oligospora TaxID=2813651 RepID=G1XBC3_ARTOA|nr:hypothetical protein AOL_s00078g220 [Orbilia oligospora ATCC 24927]EGX49731.1 hypothetical protein AOL_s00078g220 [Orbilia oligospora ATCC 24927]KAF3288392.1 hypothetical protein TWF970_005466 [Orbilia oligospora]
MQISSLTFIVTALLVNLSLGSPIIPRILEAREASPITSRRLEARDETAPPLAENCNEYKFKPVGDKKEDKGAEALCARLCENIKKNKESPTSRLFEVKLNKLCAVPPPLPPA